MPVSYNGSVSSQFTASKRLTHVCFNTFSNPFSARRQPTNQPLGAYSVFGARQMTSNTALAKEEVVTKMAENTTGEEEDFEEEEQPPTMQERMQELQEHLDEHSRPLEEGDNKTVIEAFHKSFPEYGRNVKVVMEETKREVDDERWEFGDEGGDVVTLFINRIYRSKNVPADETEEEKEEREERELAEYHKREELRGGEFGTCNCGKHLPQCFGVFSCPEWRY